MIATSTWVTSVGLSCGDPRRTLEWTSISADVNDVLAREAKEWPGTYTSG